MCRGGEVGKGTKKGREKDGKNVGVGGEEGETRGVVWLLTWRLGDVWR